jgi:hypothetical protein
LIPDNDNPFPPNDNPIPAYGNPIPAYGNFWRQISLLSGKDSLFQPEISLKQSTGNFGLTT